MVNKVRVVESRSPEERHEHVGSRITRQKAEQLDALVDAGMFLNRSDALRTAVREMLSSAKVLETRNISLPQAKREILTYLEQHEHAYPSDIADALQLDYDVVLKALREFRKSGEAEPV